jgi:hypothetical protein
MADFGDDFIIFKDTHTAELDLLEDLLPKFIMCKAKVKEYINMKIPLLVANIKNVVIVEMINKLKTKAELLMEDIDEDLKLSFTIYDVYKINELFKLTHSLEVLSNHYIK